MVKIKGLVENIGVFRHRRDSLQLTLQLSLGSFLIYEVDDNLLAVQTFLLLEMSGEAISLSDIGSELQGRWWFVSEVGPLERKFVC